MTKEEYEKVNGGGSYKLGGKTLRFLKRMGKLEGADKQWKRAVDKIKENFFTGIFIWVCFLLMDFSNFFIAFSILGLYNKF